MRVVGMLTALTVTIAGCSDETPPDVDMSDEPATAPTQFVLAPPPVDQGQRLFEHHCAMCHAAGSGHPGTMRLALRLGDAHGALLARDDLAPSYVEQILRSGLEMMPAFRPPELSDEDVVAVAGYVAQRYAGE